MKFGVCIFPTAESIQPAELAIALEDRGFESLWLPEHTHIPASRNSPWPGGAELPRMYYDVYDPFTSLAAAAAVTKTLKLATGVTLACQHHPLTLAKTAATLDRLSNGRLMLGVGGGWNREELEHHGRPFERRWKVLRETVEAMKAVWLENPAEYHGEFVDFVPVHSAPQPVQRPHPAIHVAGSAPHALRRVVRYGDGWLPILARERGEFLHHVSELRNLARDAQRDPDRIEVSVYACPPDASLIEQLARGGVTRVIFALPPAPTGEVVGGLDGLAKLVAHAASRQ
jgi:probable F420-dependent oxidoreductase